MATPGIFLRGLPGDLLHEDHHSRRKCSSGEIHPSRVVPPIAFFYEEYLTPPTSVPTSNTPVPNTQAPSISTGIPAPTAEKGGEEEEEDMDLDDDASMISRAPPSGSDIASDSDQEDFPELPLALPLFPSPPLEDDSSFPKLSSWQAVISAIKM